ncbi:ABC transporter permease [Paramaledivibacter caminithermalis]|jgi:putative ABC transport system permease protein|uniref:Putative ABC transport system permease protein n=1 Tax=Paramaledivibacter caminithermalis (strain DSM 15212 / CIP 107654 / DViRD3) TaxID=1121301 RepID=A0A1M6PWA3_PARC5|nr:FtsX-like permease family protein [Paramaledivibacter caminithermalis]SHK12211.1 putative ABC transport system permease protein [Paramaledivibacter caminithermalis DSM 15212]
MKKLNLRLIRLIKKSYGQAIAVITVIAIGLLVYTAMKMAALNLENTLNEYYDLTNFADIYVQVVKIPGNEVKDLENKYGITNAQGRVVSDVPLKVEDEEEKVTIRIISIPNNDERINNIYLIEGDGIKNKNKDVLVVEQFAKARNIAIGDTLSVQMNGKLYNLNVAGIVSSPEYIYLMENEQTLIPMPGKFGVVFVADELARQSFGFGSSYNEIVIKVKDENEIDKIEDKLEKVLKKYGVKRIIVRDNQLSNRMISEEINQLKNMAKVVPVIFLGVAALIIAVMISRMVKKDRVPIGVMKALGYKNIDIVLHYIKYSLVIGILGAIIGTNLGMLLAGAMTKMYLQYFNIPILKINYYYRYIMSAILLASIFCITAGLWGGKRVLKILPAESMRPEAPRSGKRILIERIKIIWSNLSFSWKMVMRNIFRNKKRFMFILVGISLSFAMLFLTFYQFNTALFMFENHYGDFQRMDYNINFSKPMNQRVIKDLKHLVNIDSIEPKVEFPFEIKNGWKSKVVNIIGIKRDTIFYKFENLNDEIINLPDEGIVLSENLAKFLDVSKGDTITINSFIPHRDDIHIIIKDVIKQSLGINAYMDIDQMQFKLLDKELITGAYIDSNDAVKKKLSNLKNLTSIQSLQDLQNIFKQFLSLTISSISILVIFSGILGFAVVYNSTIMGISERRLELSSLRVMGFSRKEIFWMIVKENLIMTIFGIIVGIPIGLSFVKGVEKAFSNELYTLRGDISFSIFLFSILLTVFFVVAAQLFTLKKIYKLDFMEALKSRIS